MNCSEEILKEKLEYLNNEYLSSEEYNLGKYVKYLQKLFREKKFIQLFRLLILHFSSNKKNNLKDVREKENKKICVNNLITKEKKVAIYTCITGNYDKVENPIIMEKNCDYYLFTNNNSITSDFWKITKIPDNIKELENNSKINRYIKMHPKELFPDYDYSIYIDGNIQIVSTISQLITKINDSTGLAIHRHCSQNCIFQEVKVCRAYNKGNYKNMKNQINRYKKENFPRNYGMFECNMLISDLKNKKSEEIFDAWWEEYISSESFRDQLALPYVLWKNNFKINDVGIIGEDINKNYLLKINSHRN